MPTPKTPPPSNQTATRRKFAEAIHEWVRSQKSTLQALAEKVGIGYESLRQDVSKGRFHLEDAIKIAKEIGQPPNPAEIERFFDFKQKKNLRGGRRQSHELADKIEKGTASPGDVIREIGQHKIEPTSVAIPNLFSALGEHCILVVFIATEVPSHWEPREAANWIDKILQAAGRGARIVYLYPDSCLADVLKGTGFRLLDAGHIEEEYQHFRFRLAQAQRKSLLANLNYEGNIFLLPHKAPVLCTPGLRYVLYIYPSQRGGTETRATITIHGWKADGADSPEESMVITLGKDTAKVMEKTLERSLIEAQKQTADNSPEKQRLDELLDAHFGLSGP